MATSYLGVNIPKFTGELRWDPTVGEAGGDVFITPAQQLQEWQAEQDRRAALTPAQQAIEDARYIENLEGGVETRYNPVKYGGKEYMVGPSGDMLISLADDQSGLSGKQYRTEILDPITGQKSFQVTEDKGLWKRFLQDLPKIAAGVGFVVGLPTFLESAGSALSSLSGSAGAGSGSLASNLTVGEAASAITNPMQIVTKPITNTLTDYIVNAINSNALAGVEMLPGVAEQVALTAAEKAAIKTGVGMLVNGTASELLGGDFKEGATGTLAGTILNNVPIPGSGDLLGTNKDVPFTSLVGNLATKGLDVTGISDLSDKVSEKLSDGIAKGTTAGLTTLIAGGNSDDIYRNTGLGAIMGTFGDTKIPGTKLTGDDALELIQDSFAEGTDATNLINNAAGKVVVKADVDPLDQFDPTDFFTGAGFGDDKKTSVVGGSGNDTIKPAPYDPNVDANAEDVNKAYLEILGRAGDPEGVKFWDETGLGLNDIINMFKGSDEYKAKTPSTTVTAASGNDSVSAGSGNDSVVVSATGNDSIDLGSDNDVISLGGTDTINPAAYDPNVDANREDINKAYVEVLGRVGDESGLDFWDATGLGLKDIIDLFRGSDEYRAKTPSTTVTAGGGNDTLGEDSLSITGGGGNAQVTVTGDRDSVGDSISDYIDLGGYNDLITSGSGNDIIDAGKVTVTGGGSNDSIDLGSGNDILTPSVKPSVTVTGGRDTCGAGKTFDPVLGTCIPDDIIDSFCLEGQVFDPLTGLCKPIVRNDTITTDTCPEGQERGTDGICRAKVEVVAKQCNADQYKGTDGNCYCLDPDQAPNSLGLCQDTISDIITVGGDGNDTITECPVKGQVRGADNKCVCPPGTTEQNGECKPSVTVGTCPVVGQIRDAAGNCVCPEGQTAINDPVSGGQICSTPETTIKGGGGNDTITECPTGYTFSSKTGKCEFDIAGLPALIGSLGGSDNMPGSYSPNLTKAFTATRTYKAPPATYDYAGADTVGYEDPYFQRFGPITYTPPTGYLGAGVLPSPAGGTDTDTVDGAGVDTSGGGLAYGGLLSLARGGRTLPPRYLGGITDGMADRVPANIDGERPAALSDGEFVIPADVVSHLGNGNSSAGAKVLYEMMDRVRKARTGTKKQGREIDARRFMPR